MTLLFIATISARETHCVKNTIILNVNFTVIVVNGKIIDNDVSFDLNSSSR